MDARSKIEAAYIARGEAVAAKRGTVRRIVLYRDGKVAKDVEERNYIDILHSIPIPPYYYNKKSCMLFCYDNGKVNMMIPADLLKGKLYRNGFKSNGFNTNSLLMNVIVCKKTDFLVICSQGSEGKKYIKAMGLESHNPNASMSAAGDIYLKDARPYHWFVVPEELKYIIQPIIRRYNELGCLLQDYAHAALLLELSEKARERYPMGIVHL